ncbi:unnamed protein product [Gadus morhua 'NCC']
MDSGGNRRHLQALPGLQIRLKNSSWGLRDLHHCQAGLLLRPVLLSETSHQTRCHQTEPWGMHSRIHRRGGGGTGDFQRSIDRVAGKFASVKRPAIGYVPQSMVISPVLRGLL